MKKAIFVGLFLGLLITFATVTNVTKADVVVDTIASVKARNVLLDQTLSSLIAKVTSLTAQNTSLLAENASLKAQLGQPISSGVPPLSNPSVTPTVVARQPVTNLTIEKSNAFSDGIVQTGNNVKIGSYIISNKGETDIRVINVVFKSPSFPGINSVYTNIRPDEVVYNVGSPTDFPAEMILRPGENKTVDIYSNILQTGNITTSVKVNYNTTGGLAFASDYVSGQLITAN